MCGRFTLAAPRTELLDIFPLFEGMDLPPRYNIAPTQTVPVLRANPDSGQPEPALLRWGLVPSWADDPTIGNSLINARSETVASKPAFRSAYRRRRCLIPADGFYEWQKLGGKKQPFYFQLRDRQPFALAGLWEDWEREGEVIQSFTILTTSANELVRPIHERMPVILRREDHDRWLDPANITGAGLDLLLRPFPAAWMVGYPVGNLVNNPRFDDPKCILPLAG